MQDRPTISLDELREALGKDDAPAKRRTRSTLTSDRAHDLAVAVLASLRGLSKAEKRRVLALAAKLLNT